jgi:hypothetical protein
MRIGFQYEDGFDFPAPVWMIFLQPDQELGFSREFMRRAMDGQQFDRLEEHVNELRRPGTTSAVADADEASTWIFRWEWKSFLQQRIDERSDQVPEKIRRRFLDQMAEFSASNPFAEADE